MILIYTTKKNVLQFFYTRNELYKFSNITDIFENSKQIHLIKQKTYITLELRINFKL